MRAERKLINTGKMHKSWEMIRDGGKRMNITYEKKDAMTDYLSAIVNARQGNFDVAESFLRSAFQKDPSLKSYAQNDLELVRVNK